MIEHRGERVLCWVRQVAALIALADLTRAWSTPEDDLWRDPADR